MPADAVLSHLTAVNSIPEWAVPVVQKSFRAIISEGGVLHWGLISSCPSMGLWLRLLPLAFRKPLKCTVLHMHLCQQKSNVECQIQVYSYSMLTSIVCFCTLYVTLQGTVGLHGPSQDPHQCRNTCKVTDGHLWVCYFCCHNLGSGRLSQLIHCLRSSWAK